MKKLLLMLLLSSISVQGLKAAFYKVVPGRHLIESRIYRGKAVEPERCTVLVFFGTKAQ